MTVPARAWLATCDRTWLRGDVMAGVTLAAYLLPSAIGDASLAGLPPQAGLYACLFGGLVFWLFCSSRQTALAVTSAISLLIGASLAEISGGDPARHAALASLTALLVAMLAFAAYAFRAGAIVNFFSETVLVGFKCGVALFLASTQLPKLFGFSAGHGGDFWDRMGHFLGGLGQTNSTSLMLGLSALALLLLGKTVLKNRPVALFVIIGGIVAAAVLRLDERGVALLGEVPQGLPLPSLPGARTPLSGLVAALITLVVALFFTGLLRNLPQPVLAAIILVAVTGLIQVDAPWHIWRFSRTEFAVAMAALLGVLGSGLLNGVLLGVVISLLLLLLLRRASRPRLTELGRVPGTTYFADLTRHPENERVADALVVRSEGALLYFNIDHVRDRISALVGARTVPRLIVFFMGNVPHVDLAGVEFLIGLHETSRRAGIELRLAEVHGEVREALRRAGDGHGNTLAEANQTVDAVVSRWRAGAAPAVG